ncbi:MAG TPA: hypothetical protein ACFYEM_02255 [Candidatus Hypogeohydataceae bacterium YC40]
MLCLVFKPVHIFGQKFGLYRNNVPCHSERSFAFGESAEGTRRNPLPPSLKKRKDRFLNLSDKNHPRSYLRLGQT